MASRDEASAEDRADDAPVLVRREGPIVRITLNRPRAINALSREVIGLASAALAAAQEAGAGAVLLDGAGERGFCGGGDVKELRGIPFAEGIEFFRSEYGLDHAISVSPVPVVGIMDGITMGGGIGLTGHAALRIVTERSRLAMPETRIGISPDVGGHLLLARAPGRLGELLAITGGSFGAGDALALGFADVFVPAERLSELRELLAAGVAPAAVAERVAGAAAEAPSTGALAAREWFDPIADAALGGPGETFADPAGAAGRLIAGLEASPHEAARRAAETVRGVCPVSVAVTLAQLDRTRTAGLDLAGVLADDLRVLGRLIVRPDFAEGVRAQLIDKDGAPRWSPATIEELAADEGRAELAAILDPAPAPGETPLLLG